MAVPAIQMQGRRKYVGAVRAAGHICGAGKVHIVHADSGSAYNLEPASSSLEHSLCHLHHICAESDAQILVRLSP